MKLENSILMPLGCRLCKQNKRNVKTSGAADRDLQASFFTTLKIISKLDFSSGSLCSNVNRSVKKSFEVFVCVLSFIDFILSFIL